MKNVLGFLMVLFALMVSIIEPIKAQVKASTQEVIFTDTIGNYSSTAADVARHTFTVDVDPTIDSFKISIFWKGSIDVDSLNVKMIKSVSYTVLRGYVPQTFDYTSNTVTAASKTLTTDLDSNISRYDSVVTTLYNYQFGSYSKVQFILIPATTGNDKTDTGQRAIVIANKYFRYKIGYLDFMREDYHGYVVTDSGIKYY